VIILVDRQERGADHRSAVQEASQELDISISPIVTVQEIISYLSGPNSSGIQIDSELASRIEAYRKEYGVV
jgi:orotate phosphoribosyltransferase